MSTFSTLGQFHLLHSASQRMASAGRHEDPRPSEAEAIRKTSIDALADELARLPEEEREARLQALEEEAGDDIKKRMNLGALKTLLESKLKT